MKTATLCSMAHFYLLNRISQGVLENTRKTLYEYFPEFLEMICVDVIEQKDYLNIKAFYEQQSNHPLKSFDAADTTLYFLIEALGKLAQEKSGMDRLPEEIKGFNSICKVEYFYRKISDQILHFFVSVIEKTDRDILS